jgi:putative N6-adenine-specific DNA methylase
VGLEQVLAAELRRCGATSVVPGNRGVSFSGDLSTVYRANLWCRTAHRVLMEIATFPAGGREALYEGAKRVQWEDYISLSQTLAVDAVAGNSGLDHTQFISRVVKDAIVDRFREKRGRRPDVDPRNPTVRINAHIVSDLCTLSIDTSGERLHRRGYRPDFGTPAPLKETLAAGILLLSGYDGTQPLIDPMCGSGTLLVEAALIARNIAPGLLGRRFAFMGHLSFDRPLWLAHIDEAREQISPDAGEAISGADVDETAVRAASAAVQGAGVDDLVRLRRADAADLAGREGGILVANPPYGERLGELDKLAKTYTALGDALKRRCRGMTAHLLVGSKFLAGKIGLHPKSREVLWNGGIECRLLHYDLY